MPVCLPEVNFEHYEMGKVVNEMFFYLVDGLTCLFLPVLKINHYVEEFDFFVTLFFFTVSGSQYRVFG